MLSSRQTYGRPYLSAAGGERAAEQAWEGRVTRIVLVGAGSVEFTRNLFGDILSYPELRTSTIVLHDIDADRLQRIDV